MKKFLASKYFLVISIVLILVFNAVLFLSVTTWKEELFELASFWGLYISVMIMFISLLSLGIISNKNIKGQNLFSSLILPVSGFGVLLGIILFFFVAKLKLAIVLIPYIIFVGIMVIGFVTGFAYQNHLDNIDEKIVKVIDMNGLVEFLLNLQNRTSNSVIKTTLVKLIEKASFKVKDEEKTELKKIEKRIFEYALFIEKDIKNDNVNNFLMNAETLEKLLDQRGNY
jgi:hypothetical protein